MEWEIPKICSWCNRDMGVIMVNHEPKSNEITHGMCIDCYNKEVEKVNARLAQLKASRDAGEGA